MQWRGSCPVAMMAGSCRSRPAYLVVDAGGGAVAENLHA